MTPYLPYIAVAINILGVVISLVWFFAKLDKKICLNESNTNNKLDDLKKDTEEIKTHAKYTNGKVAEVLEWKLKNEEFVATMKSREIDIVNALSK